MIGQASIWSGKRKTRDGGESDDQGSASSVRPALSNRLVKGGAWALHTRPVSVIRIRFTNLRCRDVGGERRPVARSCNSLSQRVGSYFIKRCSTGVWTSAQPFTEVAGNAALPRFDSTLIEEKVEIRTGGKQDSSSKQIQMRNEDIQKNTAIRSTL